MTINRIIKLRNRIRNIQKILKEQQYTPAELKYINAMQKVLVEYSLTNSKKAVENTLKYIKHRELTDTVIKEITDMIANQFKSDKIGLSKIEDALEENLKPLYTSDKLSNNLKPSQIMAIDIQTINLLRKSNMMWILDYANNSFVSKEISKVMTASKLVGINMTDTARILADKFSEYSPATYTRAFGEERYWKLVNHNTTFRTSAYSLINTLYSAGWEKYQWVTRGELVCNICAPYEGKIFNVKDAKDRMNNYFAAAEEGSIENMKKADPFLDEKDVLQNPDGISGMMPPIHHWCYCQIVIYYESQSN